jgi:hypothetical protein
VARWLPCQIQNGPNCCRLVHLWRSKKPTCDSCILWNSCSCAPENMSAIMLGFGQWGNGGGDWDKEVQSRTLLLHGRWRPHLPPRHRLDLQCSSSSMATPPSRASVAWGCAAQQRLRPPPSAEMRPVAGRRARGQVRGDLRTPPRRRPARLRVAALVARGQGCGGGGCGSPRRGRIPHARWNRQHRRSQPDVSFFSRKRRKWEDGDGNRTLTVNEFYYYILRRFIYNTNISD